MSSSWLITPYMKDDRSGKTFDEVWAYDLESGVIALGASALSQIPLTNIPELSKEELALEILRADPDLGSRKAKLKAGTIWQFHHETAEGDFIIAKDGMRQILAIGIAVKRSGKLSFYDKKRGFERTGNPNNAYPNFINVRWFRNSSESFPEEVFRQGRFNELEKGFRSGTAKEKYLPVIRKKQKDLLAKGDYQSLGGAAFPEETFEALEEKPESLFAAEEADEFPEGKEKRVQHLARERSAVLTQRAKEKQREEQGKNTCQACGFVFEDQYGKIGKDFIEAHHTIPVSEIKPGGKTKLSDIALVCSNCHRMLHRKRPWLTMAQLKELITA